MASPEMSSATLTPTVQTPVAPITTTGPTPSLANGSASKSSAAVAGSTTNVASEKGANTVSQPQIAVLRRVFGRRYVAVAAVALVGALAVAVAAMAADGALSEGDVVKGGTPSGPPANRMAQDQSVLLTGFSPVAGRWSIVTFQSEGIKNDSGTTIEPKGLTCVRLVLSDPPAGTPEVGSGWCGDVKGGFNAGAVPVKDAAGHSEVVLFGRAPTDAAAVNYSAAGVKDVRVKTKPGPVGDGNVWAVPVSPEGDDAAVRWVDSTGAPGGSSRDVADQMKRARALPTKGQ